MQELMNLNYGKNNSTKNGYDMQNTICSFVLNRIYIKPRFIDRYMQACKCIYEWLLSLL